MDNTGQFKLNSKFLPKNDVIFSIMFADKELFSQLLTSVIGEPVDPIEVISQANITKAKDYLTIRSYSSPSLCPKLYKIPSLLPVAFK